MTLEFYLCDVLDVHSAATVHNCIAWHGCMLNSQLNARRATGHQLWMEILVFCFRFSISCTSHPAKFFLAEPPAGMWAVSWVV